MFGFEYLLHLCTMVAAAVVFLGRRLGTNRMVGSCCILACLALAGIHAAVVAGNAGQMIVARKRLDAYPGEQHTALLLRQMELSERALNEFVERNITIKEPENWTALVEGYNETLTDTVKHTLKYTSGDLDSQGIKLVPDDDPLALEMQQVKSDMRALGAFPGYPEYFSYEHCLKANAYSIGFIALMLGAALRVWQSRRLKQLPLEGTA